jgi:hypothetical protein
LRGRSWQAYYLQIGASVRAHINMTKINKYYTFNILLAIVSIIQTYLLVDAHQYYLKLVSIPLLIIPFLLGYLIGKLFKLQTNRFKNKSELIGKNLETGFIYLCYAVALYMVVIFFWVISKGGTITVFYENAKGMFFVPHTSFLMIGIIKGISGNKYFAISNKI